MVIEDDKTLAGLLNNEKNPDPAWLVYILDQFIGNALKYGQRKGEVWKKRAETEAAKPGDVEPEEVEPGRQQAQEEEKPGEKAPCLSIYHAFPSLSIIPSQ